MLEILSCAVVGASAREPASEAQTDELPEEFFEFIADWDEADDDEAILEAGAAPSPLDANDRSAPDAEKRTRR